MAVVGVLLYPIGTVIFTKHWCNILPNIFGYHEVFHIFTVVAGWLAFQLLKSMSSELTARCDLQSAISSITFAQGFLWIVANTISTSKDICSGG